MPTRRLVLASASPARLRLLRAAGLDPEVVVSGVHEDDDGATDARAHVLHLAERKATAVATALVEAGDGDAVVVGCDSSLELDGVPYAKPSSAAEATSRWEQLRGRDGVLVTGHCVVDGRTGRSARAVAATTVRFGRPTDAEIAAYVATGEPLQVAGAFTLDGRSAPFVDGVDGDPGNVIGLSLPLLRALLAEVGVGITELWA